MGSDLIKNIHPNKVECLIWQKLDILQQQILQLLGKDKKLSFREAYKISSKIVNYAEKNRKFG